MFFFIKKNLRALWTPPTDTEKVGSMQALLADIFEQNCRLFLGKRTRQIWHLKECGFCGLTSSHGKLRYTPMIRKYLKLTICVSNSIENPHVTCDGPSLSPQLGLSIHIYPCLSTNILSCH